MDLTKVEKFKIPANISSAIIFSYQNNITYCEENFKDAYLINVRNILILIKKLLSKKYLFYSFQRIWSSIIQKNKGWNIQPQNQQLIMEK